MRCHATARAALRLAAAAGFSLLAACGSVAAPAGQPGVAARLGPPGGTHAEATSLARAMLGKLRLPAGARPVHGRVPAALRYTPLLAGAVRSVDVRRVYALSAPPASVLAAISGHRLAGMTATGSSRGSNVQSVSFAPRSLPGWAYSAQLVAEVTASQGGTLLRLDGQVLPYPWRSAAEYIHPGLYHVLTIAVTSLDTRPHHKRIVVTSAAQIARVAALANGSHAEAMRIEMCPAIFASYQITLATSLHSAPAVLLQVTKSPCLGTKVQVGGRKQPSLQLGQSLVNLADRLLGYTPGP